MNAFKVVAACVPGPIVLWLNAWLDLFSGTALSHPKWEHEAHLWAAAIGSFVSLVVVLFLRRTAQKRLKILGMIAFAVALLAFAFCAKYWLLLGEGMEASRALQLQDRWEIAFVLGMTSVSATVTLGAMYARERNKNFAAWIIGFLVLVVIALIACIYFRVFA
jgi:hypothetical protein